MLLDIQDNVAHLFETESATELDREALNYVLLGCTEGNHRLAGSRSCLHRLARIPSLSPRAKRCVENALARYAEEARLPHQLTAIGQISHTADSSPTVRVSGQQRILTFPLRWFDRTSRVQPVTILGENLSDAKVLGYVGQAGTVLAGLGYLPFSATYDGGGGSTTGLTLEHLATQETLCVCVVDSDKKSPEGPLGGTATAVSRFKNQEAYPFLSVTETQGRDLENLLPDSFYVAKYGSHIVYRELTQFLRGATSRGELEIRAHVDVEKGLKLYDCRTDVSGTEDLRFWREKEAIVVSMAGVSPACTTTGVCPHQLRRDCICQVSSGIAANVLEDFVQHANQRSRFALASELDDSVRAEWARLGSNIGSWCCGDNRVRV